MLSVLSLIRSPATGWERIVMDRWNWRFVFLGYLLPVMLIAALGQGLGMNEWRMLNTGTYGIVHFTAGRILVFEAMHLAVTLVVMAICAYFVWILRESFHGFYSYVEALKLVMCSFGPLILFQMLDGMPRINLWLSWGVGLYFSLKIFYHGIRLVSKTDPRSAEGLYFLSSGVIIVVTGVQRYMLVQCLSGHSLALNTTIVNLAAKLPF